MKTQNLSCKLTDVQIRERGEKLARLRSDISEVENSKKSAMENFKSTITALTLEADNLTEEINSKSEYRQVQVTEEKDYQAELIRTIRLDTGEVVSTEVMSPKELQRAMPFESISNVFMGVDEEVEEEVEELA